MTIGSAADTFSGATGEEKARVHDVYGYAIMALKPWLLVPTHL